MWTYPWDLVDEGPAAAADTMLDAGLTEAVLATNYHTVQTFLPHNPERRTFFARASSYFRLDNRYGRLEPVPYEGMDGDWVAAIASELPADVSLSSWTVGTHNSRLGMANPDLTIENAHGDDLVFGLCPSREAVRAYLVNLVRDLADRGHFERIELETFDYFFGTGFGWHHQKIHACLGTLGEFLFGLCFCPACRANARNRGIDVGAARETVAKTVDRIVDGAVSHERDPAAWLAAHPTVKAYATVRTETLTALFATLTEAVDGAELGYYVGAPEPGGEWLVGADLDALADHVDYYCLPAYESSREAVLDAYRTVDAATPTVPLHVGLLPAHPAIHDGETVADIVDGLREVGVPRVTFYNYGLLPERSLEWVGAATA